jgi:hypothetical protein
MRRQKFLRWRKAAAKENMVIGPYRRAIAAETQPGTVGASLATFEMAAGRDNNWMRSAADLSDDSALRHATSQPSVFK